jgi:hypothetical protein
MALREAKLAPGRPSGTRRVHAKGQPYARTANLDPTQSGWLIARAGDPALGLFSRVVRDLINNVLALVVGWHLRQAARPVRI